MPGFQPELATDQLVLGLLGRRRGRRDRACRRDARRRGRPTPRTNRSWSGPAAARRTRCSRRSGGRWPMASRVIECSRPRGFISSGGGGSGRSTDGPGDAQDVEHLAPADAGALDPSAHLEGGEDVALEVDVAGHVGPGQTRAHPARSRCDATRRETGPPAWPRRRADPGGCRRRPRNRRAGRRPAATRSGEPAVPDGWWDEPSRLAGRRASRLVLVLPRWTCRSDYPAASPLRTRFWPAPDQTDRCSGSEAGDRRPGRTGLSGGCSRASRRRISRYSQTRAIMSPKAPYHSMYLGRPGRHRPLDEVEVEHQVHRGHDHDHHRQADAQQRSAG